MESALLIAVPEAEPAVGRWRAAHDGSASVGVPAHVTLLYPFVPGEEIDDAAHGEVGAALARARVDPFEVRFERTARFQGGVLFLIPDPAEPFRRMTAALVEAFPAHPPYGGGFDEVVPHLTVADDERADLDAIDRALGARLPIEGRVDEVTLMAEGPSGWEVLATFPLGATRGA